MAMTNAERQKRHRDKRRGCPREGRWPAGYLSVDRLAKVQGVGRTTIFMAKWILRHAPDVAPRLDAGELSVAPTYRRLRNEYVMGAARAVKARPDDNEARLEETRRNGKFVFKWVSSPKRRLKT
jgi:hypothetical protein